MTSGTSDHDRAVRLAAVLIDGGRAAEGLALFRFIVASSPRGPIGWAALSRWADAVGRPDMAVALIGRAIVAEPARHQSWSDLGNLRDALKTSGASAAFQRAVSLWPEAAEYWINLAGTLLAENRPAGAAKAYGWGLRLAADLAEAWAGSGVTALAAGRLPDAERPLTRALALRPDLPAALVALASSRQRSHREDEAYRWYDRGCRSGAAEAWLNRGMLDLRRGRAADGWEGYRRRFAARGYVDRVTAAAPWRGEPLDGRRLVVWREQGLGDEVMFSRLLPVPVSRGATVVMECDPRLIPLFRRSLPGIGFTADAGTMADADFHVPIGSLPGLTGPKPGGMAAGDVADLPGADGGWLRADPEREATWRRRLDDLGPGPRIGLSWRSGLTGWARDDAHTRLVDWTPLTTVPGVTLIDLQYGDNRDEIAAFEASTGTRLHRWPDLDLRDDLEGVAALVRGLDLVVCTATAVGELAGALGVPVWRAGAPDWTFLGTTLRPWFPSMRCWPPAKGRALAEVPVAMARELAGMVADPSDTRPRADASSPPAPLPVSATRVPGASPMFEEALALHRVGRWDEARAVLDRILADHPGDGRALHLYAVIANRQGRPADALASIAAALEAGYAADAAHAVIAAACLSLAATAAERGDDASAGGYWRRALAARPTDRAAWINLAQAAGRGDAVGAAAVFTTRALVLDPCDAAAWTTLGAASGRARPAAAERAHRVALALAPELTEAWCALGLVRGRASPESALRCYARAVVLDPRAAIAHYNAGLLLLRAGNMRAGWAEHDWRFATPQFRGWGRRHPSRLWRGGNLHGSSVLIWREQGVGDEVMFSSCYRETAGRAGRVVVECDRRLVPLFARSLPGAVVRPGGTPLPRHDVNVPAGSLPRWLRGDLARFPAGAGEGGGGWLVADPALRRMWRERLDALGPGPKIGIAWRSGVVDAGRREAYLDVMDWAPVLRLPGVRFVNLQYGDTAEERRRVADRLGAMLTVWDDLDLKDDLDDLAALMAELDLALSPAASAGELAAAVGTPVWRVGAPDWTWLGTGVRPWFPTMRVWAPRAGESLAEVPRRMAAAILRIAEAGAEVSATTAPFDVAGAMASAHADLAAGLWEAAARGYRAISRRYPVDPRARVGMGAASAGAGRNDEAVRALIGALALSPADAAAWTTLGNLPSARGTAEGAVGCHRRAIVVAPDLVPAWDNLGVALARLGRLDEAQARHDQALGVDPGFLPAWINRAAALRRRGRRTEAVRSLRMALALAPDDVDAVCNLTRLIVAGEGHPLADPWMDRAVRLAPSSPVAAFNRGVALLAEGRLAEGWVGYDARFLADEYRGTAPDPACRRWDGAPSRGGKLLAWGAQGIGDQFMFAGTLPDVIAAAKSDEGAGPGRVAILVEPRLAPLFRRSFPDAQVTADVVGVAGEVDRHAPLCSLARWTRTRLADFPVNGAWMRPDPDRVASWRARLAALPQGPRIGLSWRSGMTTEDRRDEYTAPDAWAPLFALPGARVVNLLYDAEEEIAAVEARFGVVLHRWSDLDLRDDLEGLAALIANLDLVIAPATSVGEMAGALGVPVWRFGKGGGWTTLGTAVRPWFPTMRLFTPRRGEGIDALPDRMVAELARLWEAP